MCGQLGIIFGTKRRTQEEMDHLTDIFTDLLLLSERRGRHATGVAWLNRYGEHKLYKQPVPAREFVEDRKYGRVLSGIDNKTTILMGHTRWKTRGDARNNLNNHPIKTKFTLGTHNGTITNADYLFWRYGFPRAAEVDSEVIFRIADSTLNQSIFDIPKLMERLSLCHGQMSAVMATKTNPETIIVVKGNKPLEFRYHRRYGVLLYASDSTLLDTALSSEYGWLEVDISPMSVVAFHSDDLLGCCLYPFSLAAKENETNKRRLLI